MSSCVLDASAILAVLNEEPGSDIVGALGPAAVSAVNLAEVVTKLGERGTPEREIRQVLALLDLRIIPFDETTAYRAAALRQATRPAGLSLADRACLATAGILDLPAVTAERLWSGLHLDVQVQVIR